jgi:hypothetical protein
MTDDEQDKIGTLVKRIEDLEEKVQSNKLFTILVSMTWLIIFIVSILIKG